MRLGDLLTDKRFTKEEIEDIKISIFENWVAFLLTGGVLGYLIGILTR